MTSRCVESFTSRHSSSLVDGGKREIIHSFRSMAARRALRPLLDRVLVERIVAPTKSVGGVLLPESTASAKVRCMIHSSFVSASMTRALSFASSFCSFAMTDGFARASCVSLARVRRTRGRSWRWVRGDER